jgi:serine/threonine-protein kinase
MPTLPTQIGNYKIVRQLGSGGMGTVYLGQDPELDRPVAIKVLRDQVHDPEVLERFFREARAAAALRHPNIITIYASGQHEFQPFMAMEFVDGESLAEVIRRRRPLTLSDKLSYIEQICAGVHFAHRAGIIHRDIKPANLMIDREGVVRILDFGIARVAGSGMTRDGALIGTLNYMSPEQMLGRPVDRRSDIFAVGAVAYELLCYHQAFKGGLDDGLLQRLPHEDPPRLRDLYPGIPAELEGIVTRALQKKPDDRFADLAEMRAALVNLRRHLEAAASQETIVVGPDAPPPSRPSRASAAAPTDSSSDDALGLLNQPRETRDLSIQQHLAEVRLHLERGDSVKATRLLQQVLAVDPTNETARGLLLRLEQAVRPTLVVGTGPAGGSATAAAAGTLPSGTQAVRPRRRTLVLAASAVAVVAIAAAVPWLMSPDEAPSAPTPVDSPSVDAGTPPDPTVRGGSDSASGSPPDNGTGVVAPASEGASARGSGGALPDGRGTPAGRSGGAATTTQNAAANSAPGPRPPAPAPPPAPVVAPPRTEVIVPDAGLQDLLARATSMYTSGDLAGALEVLARNPSSLDDQRISDVAGRVAGAALDLMGSAEKNAVAGKASDLAADTFRAAAEVGARAESARQRNAYVEAGRQALVARDGYQRAAVEAAARRNQPPVVPAPAPPALGAAPVINPFEREKVGLTATLGRFQAAYRDRDIKALLQVFPSLQREAQQRIERSFRDCRAFDVSFDDMRFLMDAANPTRAQVTVRSTYVCTPRTNQRPVPAAQQDIFFLQKRGEVWFIDRTGSVD